MRTKLILWGKTENNEKVLVAIELVEDENLVRTYVFNEEDATEEFYNLLLNKWRNDMEVEFPENYKTYNIPLTASEDIVPEGITVEKPDLISRAKTEWHFVVLSKKFYDLYKEELEEIKEKIAGLSDFSAETWDELKQFWSKIQTHIKEKDLFRNHIESLKKKTDSLFDKLKELRAKSDRELREKSQKFYDEFNKQLDKIDEKIEKGLGLQPIFEELKELQAKFKTITFDRDHRRKLWNRIDKEFKKVKEKRFGSASGDRSPLARLERRLAGLLGAIEKMSKSIDRDKRELDNLRNKIDDSEGQLEAELRKAKLIMIEERIASKSEKFQDMLKTKEMLENKIAKEKKKIEERKKFEEAKKEAEAKIKEKVKESTALLKENEEQLLKAAEKIKKHSTPKDEKEEKDEGVIKEIVEKTGNILEDVTEKAGDIIEDVTEKAEDIIEDISKKAGIVAGTIVDKVKETIDEVKDKLKEEE